MYFVILNYPDGSVIHMSEGGENDLAMFDDEPSARQAAKNNPLGETFGYEIFELGTGRQ